MRMLLLIVWLCSVCADFRSTAFEYNSGDVVQRLGALENGCASAGCAETSSHSICHWTTEVAAVQCSIISKSNDLAFALVPQRRPSLTYSPRLPPPRSWS